MAYLINIYNEIDLLYLCIESNVKIQMFHESSFRLDGIGSNTNTYVAGLISTCQDIQLCIMFHIFCLHVKYPSRLLNKAEEKRRTRVNGAGYVALAC